VLELKNSSVLKQVKTEITGAEKNKLFPTDIGTVVNDFLVENFEQIMDYNFTATVEKEFDEIAEGLKSWSEMIHSFYKPFHQTVEKTLLEAERATGSRLLGVDPKTVKNIYARIGRYGPLVQIGENDDEEKIFANIPTDLRLESITIEQALELFKLPRKLDLFEDKEMTVGKGRFGPFIRHNSLFYSIPKGEDPMEITSERAIEIINSKRKSDAEKVIKSFDETDPLIQVLNGRWGPYIVKGKDNFKIPKGTDPLILSLSDCKAIIADPANAPKKINKKSNAASKPTAKPAAKKKVVRKK
jgi:DNA topoisomerase-1